MKKYLGFIVFMSLVFSVGLVSVTRAESGTGSEDSEESGDTNSQELEREREEKKTELNKEREVFKAGEKTEREAFKEKAKTEREVLREKIKTDRDAFKEKLKTERDAFLAELKTRKEEWKNTKSEKKTEFCEKARDIFANKFREAISKLDGFQTRVSEVITKLEADIKDTAAAEAALALSKTKLADAKAKLAGIKDVVPENTCENMTPELFEQIKLQAREAKNLLKESKNYLHDSIKELKALRGTGDDSKDESEDESADDNGTDTN